MLKELRQMWLLQTKTDAEFYSRKMQSFTTEKSQCKDGPECCRCAIMKSIHGLIQHNTKSNLEHL